MDEQGYNGWKNYETWAVALWVNNDEGSYHFARELRDETIDRDEVPARIVLADKLKEWVEEISPDLGASLWSDLLGAALSEVDWFEIAENYLEETDEGQPENEEEAS